MSVPRYLQQIFRCSHILKLHNRYYQSSLFNKSSFYANQVHFTRTLVNNSITHHKNNEISNIRDVLHRIQRENRVNYDLIKDNLPKTSLKRDLSDDEILSFLSYCSSSIPYYTKATRNALCQLFYKKLLDENNTNLEIYHNYIKICTDNLVKIDINAFLGSLTDIKCNPNASTFKLLLSNLGKTGDVVQIINVLNMMKDRGIPLDEQDFNCIVQAHTIKGGLNGGESVVQTMRATLITESNSTIFALLKGVALRNDDREFWTIYRKYQHQFGEEHFLQILEIIALNGNLQFLKQVLNEALTIKNSSKDSILKIDMLCIHLINMQQPRAAMLIYQSLVDPVPDKKYGHFLLREMLICGIPVDVIIEISKHLRDVNLNHYSLENTTEIALRLRKFDVAYRFLNEFQYLRPHFYWPFIIDATQKNGESGVLDVLEKMLKMDVKLDRETLYNYVIPHCNLKDPKLLVKKLQNYGCTVKDVLPCLLIVLLENNQTAPVQQLCDNYNNVQIYDDKLLKILPSVWYKTKKNQPIVSVLQRLREAEQKNDELIGNFLNHALKHCNTINDFKQFSYLVNDISSRKLRLNTASSDILLQNINKKCHDETLRRTITNCINDLEDLSMQTEQHLIIHPRDMDLEQLECHLTELKAKKMETRGVLRKLIQQHCSVGNFERMHELREEFLKLNYEETPGMKSSIMFTMIKQNNLELAIEYYRDLKTNHPNFKLDHFKIIDLITLMVKNKQFKAAKDCLIAESRSGIVGNQRGIERNCWNLLLSFDDDREQKAMFDLLLTAGYCKPTNVLLGPLIKIHLKNGEVEKAGQLFVQLAKKYNCTPLQLEVISAIIESENQEILKQIIDVSTKIHGEMSTNMAVVAAMAEKGLEKSLKKYVSKIPPIPNSELTKRCNRWIDENKLEPLLVLERVLRNIRSTYDTEILLVSIMKIYGLRNDCESALAFYEELYANEQLVSKSVENELINLLNKCKYQIPEQIKLRLFNK